MAKIQSVEPNIADLANGWMKSYRLDYKLEQESLNTEIDQALNDYASKNGGTGGNRPDAKLLLQDKNLVNYPVLIEYKGYKDKLVKLDAEGKVANKTAKNLPDYKTINSYAVNGAVHYANALLHYTSYTDIIAIGMTGYKDDTGALQYEIGVYYVSKSNFGTKYFVFLSQHGKSNGKGGLSYKTVKNIRGVLSSAYEYALENRYVNENPVSRSRMPSFPHSIKKDVPEYNAQQVRKLLLYAKEHESHIYIFLLLALYTGLRKGELLALTWEDVDYDKKLLNVNKSRTGSRKDVTMQITTPKTASSNRKIPINDTVLEALKEEKQRQEDYAKLLGNGYDKSHNFIVRTVLGKPYVNLSAINRVVNRLTKNAGLPHCTIHGFRHSVASILDDNGVPIQDISVLLGHESVNTTERIYINRRKTAKEATINTLDSAINLNIA